MTILATVEDGNGNVLEQTIDNGDGTGTRTTYNLDGTVASEEQLTGLEIPEPPRLTAEERIAALEVDLAAALALLGGG